MSMSPVAPSSAVPGPRHPLAWTLVLALPALVLVAVFARFVIDVPTGDDFFAILQFLQRWEDRPAGVLSSLRLLFVQFYSHRIPFTNLATVTDALVLGRCDLRLLCFLAWSGWLLLLGSVLQA